jgi:quinone-modifying oxidoreductase subunit QmoC
MAPKTMIGPRFAQKFWDNLTNTGRVNELKLGLALYFINGLGEGVKTAMAMQDVGLGMLKTKRMDPMEILGGHGVKDQAGFHAMLKKAEEIELAKIAKNQATGG